MLKAKTGMNELLVQTIFMYFFLSLIFPGNKVKGIMGKEKCTNAHSCEHFKSGRLTVKMRQKQKEKSVILVCFLFNSMAFC